MEEQEQLLPQQVDAPGTLAPDDLMAENTELRTALRAAEARGVLAVALTASGARTPELLLASVTDAMQFTDDGRIANAEALVASLRTRFPEQFGSARTTSIDGGAGRSTPPPLTREALAKMTPAEIAKLDWAVVRNVLAAR